MKEDAKYAAMFFPLNTVSTKSQYTLKIHWNIVSVAVTVFKKRFRWFFSFNIFISWFSYVVFCNESIVKSRIIRMRLSCFESGWITASSTLQQNFSYDLSNFFTDFVIGVSCFDFKTGEFTTLVLGRLDVVSVPDPGCSVNPVSSVDVVLSSITFSFTDKTLNYSVLK